MKKGNKNATESTPKTACDSGKSSKKHTSTRDLKSEGKSKKDIKDKTKERDRKKATKGKSTESSSGSSATESDNGKSNREEWQERK